VHALRHVHRLAVPGGTMVDVHPLTEGQVEAGGRRIGIIEEPEFTAVDLPNAERCLGEAVDAGLYTLETETEFDFLQHFDDADELFAAQEDPALVKPALARRIRAARPPLVIREHVVVRRFRVE
jgi:hypothetical protein